MAIAKIIASNPNGAGVFMAGLADFTGNGQTDVLANDVDDLFAIVLHENQFGSFANQMVPPAAGTYLEGQAIDFDVHFGVPVTVTGTPEVDLLIGDQTVTATYVSGTGTPTLTFRYVVQEADRDLDGIALASTTVALPAGASMVDPVGDDVIRTLPAADLSSVLVNGSAPRVSSIKRLDPAAGAADTVQFAISFSEPVTGVTTDTFAPQAADGLDGTAVTGVSGSGTDYVVTLSTGTGSGSLGLTNGIAGIIDAEDNPLATPIVGGEVYTLQRDAARRIETFFTGGHADVSISYGANQWNFSAPGFDLDVEEVLIVGGADSQVAAPLG